MVRLWTSLGSSNTEATPPKQRKPLNGTTAAASNAAASSALGVSPGRNRPRLASKDKADLKAAANGALHAASSMTPTHSPRRRINSRDIPRSYSGMYGFADDLLPFEMHRNRSVSMQSFPVVFTTYLTLLVVLHSLSICFFQPFAWTATHVMHLAVTEVYIHWLKGSLYDDQGEMAALTVWEQLEASEGTSHITTMLTVVPTLLCWAACQFSQYDPMLCVVNAIVWVVEMMSKLPAMNGVRLFGINRTPGIDDEQEKEL
jgi:ORMDL family